MVCGSGWIHFFVLHRPLIGVQSVMDVVYHNWSGVNVTCELSPCLDFPLHLYGKSYDSPKMDEAGPWSKEETGFNGKTNGLLVSDGNADSNHDYQNLRTKSFWKVMPGTEPYLNVMDDADEVNNNLKDLSSLYVVSFVFVLFLFLCVNADICNPCPGCDP